MKKTRGKRCYLCGNVIESNSEGDGDHIPPRNIFPTTVLGNLITVPTHKRCNNILSDSDETFRNYLTSACFENSTARELHKTKVKRSLVGDKQNRLLSRLRDEVTTDDGERIEGPLFLIDADDASLMPQFERIVRGLYYHRTNSPLPVDTSIEIYFESLEEFINAGFSPTWEEIGKNVFRYFLYTAKDMKTKGIAGLLFYEQLFCLGFFD